MKQNYSEKIKRIMQDAGVSQRTVAGAAGVSDSAVSGWVNGYMQPSMTAKMNLIAAFKLPDDYFTETQAAPEGIDTMSVQEAASLMHKTPQTIMLGLQQRVFPWGYAIRTSEHRWSYYINRKRFCETEGIQTCRNTH